MVPDGRCHYTGRLSSNGQVFDSSYERRRPLTFTIGVRQVIQGWDLGIVGTDDIPAMKEGGKRKLIIPPGTVQGSVPSTWGMVLLPSMFLKAKPQPDTALMPVCHAELGYGSRGAGGKIPPNAGMPLVCTAANYIECWLLMDLNELGSPGLTASRVCVQFWSLTWSTWARSRLRNCEK